MGLWIILPIFLWQRRRQMKIVKNNWDYAEPGMLFWDKITNYNFMSADKTFELAGTNPCALGNLGLM